MKVRKKKNAFVPYHASLTDQLHMGHAMHKLPGEISVTPLNRVQLLEGSAILVAANTPSTAPGVLLKENRNALLVEI